MNHHCATQTVTFDVNAMYPFEVGALFQALLARPRRHEIARRQKGFVGLCAGYAAELSRTAPDEAEVLRRTRPEYFTVKPAVAGEVVRRTRAELRWRLFAMMVARSFINQGIIDLSAEVAKQFRGLTLLNIARYAAAVHGIRSVENLIERGWQPALPVLHLLVGLDKAMAGHVPSGRYECDEACNTMPLGLPLNLLDVSLVRSAVKLSAEAEAVIDADDRIRVTGSDMVRIVWLE